jgi:hypothetical protein
VSHALYGIVAFLLLRDLTGTFSPDVPLFNATGLTMLWSIAAVAIAALNLPRDNVRRFYLYTAHAMFMAGAPSVSRLSNGRPSSR